MEWHVVGRVHVLSVEGGSTEAGRTVGAPDVRTGKGEPAGPCGRGCDRGRDRDRKK